MSEFSKTLAIAATFTAEPVSESLEFWMNQLNEHWKIQFAPYNQVLPQLLDPAGVFSQNPAGANVALVRLEDLIRFAQPEDRAAGDRRTARLERDVRDLVAATKVAAARPGPPCFLFLCPDSESALADPDWSSLARKMESLLKQELAGISGVSLVTHSEVASLYPVPRYDDPYRDQLGHIPYLPLYFAALGTVIFRKVQSLSRAPYKVIVLDCDQTLWKGVCAEDGIHGIEIDAPRKRLQQFMVGRQEAGMLLCLCSRNRDEDIARVFELRQMPLARKHIVSWRINWQPKSENIRSLAEELGLGLESFIFVDDDPVICAEVRAACPQVLTLLLPEDANRIPRFVEHVWDLDPREMTAEDAQRTELYRKDAERRRSEQHSASLEEFLESLALKVEIAPMAETQVARVAQLTQRTNQFNATGIRRTESEIRELERSGRTCLVADVSDRFGDYGLVGVMILESLSDVLSVDTFLLSCRAIGRGVEGQMLSRLGQIALERGLAGVEIPYRLSERNEPILDFLRCLDAEVRQPSDSDRMIFRLTAEAAVGMAKRRIAGRGPTGGLLPRTTPAPNVSRPEPPPADSERIVHIASFLTTPEEILAAIASGDLAARPGDLSPYVPARTDMEQRLTRIWTELLKISPVGVEDSFFELGGNSLQMTLLISRVRDAFGAELSLPEFFDAPRISGLARAIEKWEIRQAEEAELAAVLEDVGSLSDEEIRAQLASEGLGAGADDPARLRS